MVGLMDVKVSQSSSLQEDKTKVVASESSQREKAQSSYVTRGQAQVMCDLYVENVPEGGMDNARHRDLLNNTLNILSSFNPLWTEP